MEEDKTPNHVNVCRTCTHYKNICTRIGEMGLNKGIFGVCWMEPSEGEY